MNKLNKCILGESGTGPREQDTKEKSNRRQSVLLPYTENIYNAAAVFVVFCNMNGSHLHHCVFLITFVFAVLCSLHLLFIVVLCWQSIWSTFLVTYLKIHVICFNHLIPTLKPQSNGPLYSNAVIGTLAVDGWTGLLHLVQRGVPGRDGAPPSLAVPNATAHTSMASIPSSYYLMCHYNCLWTLKG